MARFLTNGWDRHQRRATVESFAVDYDEFQDRHVFLAHDFETGRGFTREDFTARLYAQSAELPGSIAFLDELKTTGLQLASSNNESREINEHRIRRCALNL